MSNTTEERKVRFDSVVRVSDDLRSILSWSLEVAQPHETSKDPIMVDAPTFNLCTPCSGLCRFVPAESQFRMKKLTKVLCDACEVDSQGGKCHWL